MAETLTVLRLGVPATLARTLRSTNTIESMIEICREHGKNVKRWRDGQMALRWCAAGMIEAGRQFRRVNGHLHLPKLRTGARRVLDRECQRSPRGWERQGSLMITGARRVRPP
jgi:putative transposase